MARKRKSPRQQTFSITAPTAMSVLLAGDFTHWQQGAIPMERQEGGVWKTTIELAPGTHHYRFIVDGQWRDDPDCMLHVANPYGSANSVCHIA